MPHAGTLIAPDYHELIGEIVELLGICGGSMPDTHEDLWRYVAIHRRIDPSGPLEDVAKEVAADYHEAWDSDYWDDDKATPSLSAYEMLVTSVHRERLVVAKEGSPIAGTAEDDDEGADESAADLSAFRGEENQANWNLQAIVQDIRDGVLTASPERQRSFAWKPKKQRRLIESLILRLPIPSFLFFEDTQSGKKYVIDGRQRLETISNFTAPKEQRGEPRRRFKTFSAKEEGWRPGEKLHGAASRYYEDLPPEFKNALDGATLQVATFRDISPDRL